VQDIELYHYVQPHVAMSFKKESQAQNAWQDAKPKLDESLNRQIVSGLLQ